jgi:hypothetical protein
LALCKRLVKRGIERKGRKKTRGEKGEISIKLSDTPWQDRKSLHSELKVVKEKKAFPTVAGC